MSQKIKKICHNLKQLQAHFIGVFVFVFLFAFTASAQTVYAPNFPFTIGEFLYEDDYTASTADCNISIWNPSGSLVVNNVLMTEDANGWHYYNFAGSATQGTWPATMSCGTAGVDLVKGDKTFIIATSTGSAADVATAVWGTATSTFTTPGSVGEHINNTLDAPVSSAGGSSLTASDVWSFGGRSLDTITNITSGVWNIASSTVFTVGSMGEHLVSTLNGSVSNIASSVWSYTSRLLTGKTLTDGGQLATETYVDTATSTLNTNINNTINNASSSITTLVNANTNSAIATASSSLASIIPLSVWNVASSTVFSVGSMGEHLVSTLTGSVSNIAYSVWNYTSRLLTGKTLTDGGQLATESYVDTATSTLNTNINTTIENASSSITTLVNANTNSAIATASSSLAATIPLSVWNVASSTVFTVGSMGSHLVSTLTGSVSNIASSVWSYTSRLLTGKSLTDGGQLATESYVDTATSTLNTNINTTIENASSSITTLVNANTNSVVENASSSLASAIETRASLSSQQAGWVVTMSDFGETTTGQAYRVRLTALNYESVPTDAASLPIITITDSAGSEKLPGGTTMIRDSAGVYHYNYTVPSDAVGGTWETQVSTEVESGKTISTNDYWRISSSPADVLILSMADRIIPVVTASVQLMNKGTAGSDFYYVYCVVDSEENQCGGNDDTDYKSMTEYINPGETLSRSLSLDVPTAGTYWFKLKARALNEVNWAASAEQFVAEADVVGPSCGDGSCNGSETCNSCSADCGQCNNNGGGGGGGGGTPPPVNPPPPEEEENRNPADFQNDRRVNSVDFSILLYFWRTAPPFANPYVDINKDNKVDSVDFSILLYHWGESS